MKSVEAAAALNITPAILRRWQLAYEFPTSHLRDGRRDFPPDEIAALAAALAVSPSIPAAIVRARQSLRQRKIARSPIAVRRIKLLKARRRTTA